MLQPEDESSTDLSMVSLERKQQEGSVHKCVKGLGRSLMLLGVTGAKFVDSMCDHGLFKLS